MQDDQNRQQGLRRGAAACGSAGKAQDVFGMMLLDWNDIDFAAGGHQARIIPKSSLISCEFIGTICKQIAGQNGAPKRLFQRLRS